jgi:hypothetical protein
MSRVPAAIGRRSLAISAVAAPAETAVQEASRDFPKAAHGFELVQQQFVREYDSHVLLYKHSKTGGNRGTNCTQLSNSAGFGMGRNCCCCC